MSDRYVAAVSALYALSRGGIVLGRESVRAALAHFGEPHRRFRVAHIAGTNGKGSTAAMVARALIESGRRVGLYTSPHLHRFAERAQIQGEPAQDALIADALERVLAAREAAVIPQITLFEAATVAAWLVFAQADVQDVVLEVGLGGRLDATNVCAPTVCAISSIGLDHTALLGDTIPQIAREKAGILKTGVPFVLGPSLARGDARDAILEVARAVGAVRRETPSLSVLSVDERARALVMTDSMATARLGLAGLHQVDNARTALGVLRALEVPESASLAGLERVRWPARCERIENVLIDAAHNPAGIDVLRAVLERDRTPRAQRALVFGASSDKDWRAGLDALDAVCARDRRYFCAANLGRAEAPSTLASHGGGVPCDSVADALARARAEVGPEGLVIVCGSIFVAAAARAALLGEREDPPLGL